MSITTTEPVDGREVPIEVGIVDTDVHPSMPTPDTLDAYLPARWRKYAREFGTRTEHSLATGSAYKPLVGGGMRMDAWPEHGPPGSDLELMREQLLDAYGVECAMLQFLNPIASQLNLDYGAALARAANDWQLEAFVAPEPRLKVSMAIPYEDPIASVAEIDRIAGDPGVAQVMMVSRSLEPFGRRKYWPIYEAAERHGLPIAIHLSEIGGHPNTPSGFASYYLEYHVTQPHPFQTHLMSLICEGVFDRFPRLRVVFVEGGLAWVPSLMARLDHTWERVRAELPDLQRRPSEYIDDHLWCSTQPMEEPERAGQLAQVFREFGIGNVLFSTDYPHWDFDSPRTVLPGGLIAEERVRILSGNGRALYGLPAA